MRDRIMKVRITSQGEFDRHDAEIRFVATADGRTVHITITTYALFIIGEALGMAPGDPRSIYAASGRLLEEVVASVIVAAVDQRQTYVVTHNDVLAVTGRANEGNPHVPRRWSRF